MTLGLEGRRALITGASRGIGAAIAKALAAQGVWVGLLGRDAEATARQAEWIEEAGGRAVTALADLGDDVSRTRAFDHIRERMDGVDIVVHAAAAYPAGTLLHSDPAQFTALYDANVVPFVAAAQAFSSSMIDSGFGRFVAIADIAALMPLPGSAAYTASKAALLHLSKLLSKELAGTGVTSNAVSPGLIRTPGSEKLFGELADDFGWPSEWNDLEPLLLEHVLTVPVGRAGQPDDIAHAVAFLCSDAGSYISGANLTVDGGAYPCL